MTSKLKLVVILLISLSLSLLSVGPVRALSPSIKVKECIDNPFAHVDCKRVLCEFDNIARNWPEHTGFNEDCSSVQYTILTNYNLIIAGSLTGTGILTWVILKKIKKPKRVKQPQKKSISKLKKFKV